MTNRELFIRWYYWSVAYKDCDPAVWMTNYLNERYEHNSEERFWLAWLYGNTYNLPTAWVIKNEFPDFELANYGRMDKWNSNYYKLLRYQTDTKWNKGHLHTMFQSYQDMIGDNLQGNVLNQFEDLEPEQAFDKLWNLINTNLFKFGRYSTWFYMQHLKSTCGVKIEPPTLMLNDYSGSRSHRNGLLYALDMQDKIDQKLTAKETALIEIEAKDILEECRDRWPHEDFDFFTMETCLCSFKKVFRKNNGRYLGYYLDRQSEEIIKAENDGWNGIDWNVLWQAREESLLPDLAKRSQVDKNKYGEFLDTGSVSRLDWCFDDIETKQIGLELFYE